VQLDLLSTVNGEGSNDDDEQRSRSQTLQKWFERHARVYEKENWPSAFEDELRLALAFRV
jgi:hypothetical protein